MKILQINTVINYNATGRIAEDIGKMALSKGWESFIAFGCFPRESQSELLRIGSDFTFKFHVLQNRLFDNHGAGSIQATKKLIRQIKAIEPDIIHLHNVHGYYVNIKILFDFLVESNVPIVWTLHDCWSFTGHCAYFDYADCEKWKLGCYKCPQIHEYPKSWIIDRSKQNFLEKQALFGKLKNLTIVSVSEWHASLVRQSFLKGYSLLTINNGVDLSLFKRSDDNAKVKRKFGVQDDRTLLLGVASVWESRKGFHDFIKLSSIVDAKVVIVLVGLNEMQLRQLPDNIIGLARTENIMQLVELYSGADLFLNLTYEDNFPTTNLESLACGTPVLTYRTGGSVESISEDTGFIVEKGDLTGVLEAIETVRQSSKDSYVNACRSRAVKYYNDQDCYRAYFNLYDKLAF